MWKTPAFPRLPVDRVFSIKGSGTVVTGTLLGGKIHSGDQVMIYPQQTSCRVRGVQVHEQEAEACEAGQRSALNLVQTDRRRAVMEVCVSRKCDRTGRKYESQPLCECKTEPFFHKVKEVLNIRLDYIFIAGQQKFCAEQFRCPVRKLSRGNQPMSN